MRSDRHPNPLKDVRRPRKGEQVGVNPPGFIWKPVKNAAGYRLQLATDRKFDNELCDFTVEGGRSLFVPPQPLKAGRWYWRWATVEQPDKWSQVFAFEIHKDAAEIVLGSADALVAQLGGHPRVMVARDGVAALRRHWADPQRDLLVEVLADADRLLGEGHELDEPPFLPDDRKHDYNTVHVVWRKAMNDTRIFCGEMVRLAMAYLVSGREDCGRAAVQRLLSLSRWDADGSTSIPHNDEPHMAVLHGGPIAFDWTFDLMTDAERDAIVAHLAHRAENTWKFLHDGGYGIDHFSSHSGRMVGFLGCAGIAMGGHHASAGKWLRTIMELMVSMYPVWGDKGGGWGEGFSYCSAYVRWILQFCFAARTALGFDLYAKPFFRNHARWWAMCLPPWVAQTPFGDGGDGIHGLPVANGAVITGHLGRITGDPAVVAYSQRLQRRLDQAMDTGGHGVSTRARNNVFIGSASAPLMALLNGHEGDAAHPGRAKLPQAEVFPDVGYAAFRSHPEDAARDIALVLKSSPYGPVGHSHGDQNCFVLSAFGQPLAIRTGYYTGYSSAHHHNWVRQTKAHNGVTASGAGQWVRNYNAVGRIAGFKRSRDFAWACGDASAAYGGRLTLFHRHVLFVGYRWFLVLDDLAADVETTYEFHLHALDAIAADEAARHARISRGGVVLDAHYPTPTDMRFYTSEGFDPPNDDPGYLDVPTQYHLRVATVPPLRRLRTAMVLVPNRIDGGDQVSVESIAPAGDVWGFRVSVGGQSDEIRVASREPSIDAAGATHDAIALWLRDDKVKLALKQPK